MMQNLVQEMINAQESNKDLKITQAEYHAWSEDAMFDALRGVRRGQSFCNHFGITDYILFYETSEETVNKHIRQNYIKRKS